MRGGWSAGNWTDASLFLRLLRFETAALYQALAAVSPKERGNSSCKPVHWRLPQHRQASRPLGAFIATHQPRSWSAQSIQPRVEQSGARATFVKRVSARGSMTTFDDPSWENA
jgi:hypothetical protein